MEDRQGRQGRQEDKRRTHRDQRRSSHSPVVVVDNSQVYEQVSGYSAGGGSTHREYGTQDTYQQRYRPDTQEYEDMDSNGRHSNDNLNYDVPRHYSQAGENMRTAKKKSNLVNKELEERIRKASGVARQHYV